MKKVNAVIEGLVVLWVVLISATTFLSMCVSGMCSPEWVSGNVVISSIVEIVFFIWMVVHIQRGANDVFQETKNLFVVKSLYKRVLKLSVIVAFYGLITFCFSSKMFNHFTDISNNEVSAARIYLMNVVGIALLFFIWMWIEIYKINKRTRFQRYG